MSDYKDLVKYLREEADAVQAIEWEIPICTSNHINKAADVIEQLVKERDAAVAAVAEHPYCYNCKHRDKSSKEHPCIICNQIWPNASECKWQWRGLGCKHE